MYSMGEVKCILAKECQKHETQKFKIGFNEYVEINNASIKTKENS